MVTAQFSSPATFCVTTDNLNDDGYCMSPAPTAATFHPLHVVTTNAAGICIIGPTAATGDASTLIFSNVSYISITGFDGTSDFRIKPDYVYTEELTEFVDNNGTTIYVDGNGNPVPLPPNATLCRQGCDIDVSFVGTQATTVVTDDCYEAFDRVYQIAANCSTSTVTQRPGRIDRGHRVRGRDLDPICDGNPRLRRWLPLDRDPDLAGGRLLRQL